ncbi:hypothetical protein [Melittangium boletus]|uniref:Uncharacterized protein n=1 Tax=Melittangium boletus DSM 14713 TaxID=1294270 RepID=A0A250ILW5_9BACT|nr:hypothetical protein [Melittangium boletus]ATB31946.1 hypothetical protein MEBOL_005418 [Melittangium boletus DSM 14713]
MPPTPKWFDALKKDPKALDAGIHWFTPEESEAKRLELLREYEPALGRARQHLPDEAFTAARALVERFLPVGLGPTATDRLGNKTRSWLLVEKQSAVELKVALSPLHPPLFWLSAGQTVATLKDVLATYFPAFAPSEDKLERTVRGFLGTNARDHLDLIQLHDRYKASAFMDGVAWGSAYPREPVLDMLPKGAAGQAQARRYREQAPTGMPTFSFRSLYSRSILTAEAHVGGVEGINLFIARLRYRPAKQAPMIREINQRLGTKYPEDLPVDLAGALTGLPFDTSDTLRAALSQPLQPAQLSFTILCLDGLAPDQASAERQLREFMSHPEGSVRQLVAHLALRRGLKGLLSEMAQAERHPELQKQISAAVQRLG